MKGTHSYSVNSILKWLWHAWKGNRLQAALNAGIGLLSVVVSLGQVWAVQHAIEVAEGVAKGSLYVAVGIMAALILADFGLHISSIWIKNILGIRAQNRMQQRMLDRILRSEWQGKDSRHSGDVLNRLEFDVNNVVNFLTEIIPSTLSVVALFIGAFCYLFSMDRVLALITVAIIPVFIGLSKIYVGRMRKLTRDVRTSDSKVQSVLQETIQNRMLIKTLESDDHMVSRLESTQSELRRKVVKRTAFSVVSNLIVNFGFALGYLVAFLWAALRMSSGTLSFGGMTAFLQLVNRIQSPARSLTKLVPQFVSVFTAAERLMELEENPLEEQGKPIYMDVPCGVRLSHVRYAYDDVKEVKGDEAEHEVSMRRAGLAPVIDDLSFDFRPGSCTAILGETGAGKTTLVRLILALLSPQEGQVEIYDDRHVRQVSPRLRCNFVYVPQGNTLLSGTIRDNLRLGRLDATDEEILEALHDACADFVNELPQGLDTICSEKGGGLSEGQAQRIAIARALLRDRPIMLFDEATSALDPETERQLLQNILGHNDKTVVFITHRPAVVEYCDQVLEVGKCV
jgi:ABC-type multidrug transport system fused ATPase/permease subunit